MVDRYFDKPMEIGLLEVNNNNVHVWEFNLSYFYFCILFCFMPKIANPSPPHTHFCMQFKSIIHLNILLLKYIQTNNKEPVCG